MPAQGKPWEAYGGGGGGSGDGSVTFSVSGAGRERGGNNEEDQLSEGPWNFQPATVLKSNGPLVQVVWGRGPGAQQDYLLTLGEDGRYGVIVLSLFVFVCRCHRPRNGWERGIIWC